MILPWLQLVRWKNLLIILFTQFLCYNKFFKDYQHDSKPELSDVCLFIFCTLCIAAGGFILNEICDIKTDFINKPASRWILGNSISIREAETAYLIIFLAGALVAIYLSIHLSFFNSFLIYPLAVYCFWIYSKYLKCSCLFGNFWVSIFIALVILMMPYLFIDLVQWWKIHDTDLYHHTLWSLGILAAFAFLSNMVREMIKDLEDVAGDTFADCRTTVVQWGEKRCRALVILALSVELIFALGLMHIFSEKYYNLLFCILVMLPILILTSIFWTKHGRNYSLLSALSKWTMLSGIIYFVGS